MDKRAGFEGAVQPADLNVDHRWAAYERILFAVVVLGFIYSAGLLVRSWSLPLLDLHNFRQTQTAITVRWMARGAPLLNYETPIFGSPWTVPFEFPLFQWTALLLYKAGIDLENAGRLASWLYFVAGLPLAAFTIRRLGGERPLVLIFLALWLFSPLYAYFSRAFMIESCATFLGLAFLAALTAYLPRAAEPGRPARLLAPTLLLIATAVTAALVKVTTFAGFAIAGGAVTIWALGLSWRTSHRDLRALLIIGSGPALAILVSLGAISVWTTFTDAAKAQNPLTAQLTASALRHWNFGIDRILTPEMWSSVILGRGPLNALGSRYAMFVALVCALVAPRSRPYVYAGFAFYLAPFFIFTNLHYVHDYYQYANGFFLLLSVAGGIWGLGQINLDRRSISPTMARGAALAVLATVLLGSILTLESRFLPAFRPAHDKAELMELAYWLTRKTAPDEAIFIIGFEWSSTLPYYADRRSVMFPAPYTNAVLRHSPTDLALWTGGRPVGAVVDCGGPVDARLSTWMRPLEARYATSTIVAGCRVYH